MALIRMLELHVFLLLVLIGTEVFFTWLEIINLRYAERRITERAKWIQDHFEVENISQILDYHRAKAGIDTLSSWAMLGFVLLVLYSGLFGNVIRFIQSTELSSLAQGFIFFVGTTIVLYLVALLFDIFDTFVVEEIFNFNEQSIRLYSRDTAIKLILASFIAGVLGTALLWIIRTFPELWVPVGTILFLAFFLMMQVVYPRIIAPLFYDFDPLEEENSRNAIKEVFERAGFECDQVYEIDASRRSSHSNAYFIGFGRTKRVVLFDTLINQMEISEIQSVLAHELAHWKKGHIWKLMGVSVIQVGILLISAQILLAGGWLPAMFDVPIDATYAELFLALLLVHPLARWLAPVQNQISLVFEREADDFAVEITDVPSMVGALTTFASENLSNPFLHPLYKIFYADHPPIPERIQRLKENVE